MKICSKCKQEKLKTEFYVRNHSKDKLTVQCKECLKDESKKIHANDPSKKWNRRHPNVFTKSGDMLNLEIYREMIESQSSKCSICDTKFAIPCIDHNRSTNEIREMLCTQCNSLLGMCKENIDILLKAIDYLNKHNL